VGLSHPCVMSRGKEKEPIVDTKRHIGRTVIQPSAAPKREKGAFKHSTGCAKRRGKRLAAAVSSRSSSAKTADGHGGKGKKGDGPRGGRF